jgi:hypothetical protein
MGIDSCSAVALRRGEETTAELAAIPDSPHLKAADEAIVTADYSNADDRSCEFKAKIERMPERIGSVSADIGGGPQTGPIGGMIREQRELPGDVRVKSRLIVGRIGSVARCHVHHVLRDEVNKELFAIARQNVIGREVDPHGCP